MFVNLLVQMYTALGALVGLKLFFFMNTQISCVNALVRNSQINLFASIDAV